MNDDFVKDYRREPSPEFRQALYARISQPMNAQITPGRRLRARALAVACALVLLCGAALLTPPGRTFANEVLYRIGIVTISEIPAERTIANEASGAEPTAEPPGAPVPQSRAADAAAASALAGFPVLDLLALPAGYAAAEDWVVIKDGQRVSVVRDYADGSGHSLTVIQLKAAPGETSNDVISPGETATPVEINGADGLLIEGVRIGEGPFVNGRPATFTLTRWLRWAADGINYTMWGDGVTAEQLVAIAQGMR